MDQAGSKCEACLILEWTGCVNEEARPRLVGRQVEYQVDYGPSNTHTCTRSPTPISAAQTLFTRTRRQRKQRRVVVSQSVRVTVSEGQGTLDVEYVRTSITTPNHTRRGSYSKQYRWWSQKASANRINTNHPTLSARNGTPSCTAPLQRPQHLHCCPTDLFHRCLIVSCLSSESFVVVI